MHVIGIAVCNPPAAVWHQPRLYVITYSVSASSCALGVARAVL